MSVKVSPPPIHSRWNLLGTACILPWCSEIISISSLRSKSFKTCSILNNSNDFFLQSLFQVIILWTSSPLIWKMTLVSNAKLGLRMESLQLGRDMLLWQCWYLLRLPNCYRQENFSKPSRADKWNWDASQEVENPLQRYVVVGNWTFKVSSKKGKKIRLGKKGSYIV